MMKHSSARLSSRLNLVLLTFVLLASATAAIAQEAPAPRRMPRTPVNQQQLYNAHNPVPASRDIQGQPVIADGERLRIGDTDLRLFGIVPPQLSANFGPQARAVLDNLAGNQSIDCQIRDRDHDGRFLATCRTQSNADLAMELLKRGLAVTARGSLNGSELATPYLAAEQAAQMQKIGLWSVNAPSPASSSPEVTRLENRPENIVAPVVSLFDRKDKTATADKSTVADKTGDALAPAQNTPAQNASTPAFAVNDNKPAKTVTALSTASQSTTYPASDDSGVPAVDVHPGFIERYQLLVTGLVMLVTALSILGVITARQRADRRDEVRAVAAALRGELMAARGVCLSRAKSITNDHEDKASAWPRLRATLYQAYVGRLGFLGAELSRQIASIYGQASDYAAYYNTDADRTDAATKRQALQNIAQYIEEVLPKLALIEQTGSIPATTGTYLTSQAVYAPRAQAAYSPTGRLPEPVAGSLSSDAAKTRARFNSAPSPASMMPQASTSSSASSSQVAAATAETGHSLRANFKQVTPPTETIATRQAAYQAALQKPTQIWEAVRNFAREHMPERHGAADDGVTDYTRLIEEEMSGYASFDEVEDELHEKSTGYAAKLRETGS
jgi:endonuclease YncB( thermonuclease family)